MQKTELSQGITTGQWEALAHKIAQETEQTTTATPKLTLLNRLNDLRLFLRSIHAYYLHALQEEVAASYAGEWPPGAKATRLGAKPSHAQGRAPGGCPRGAPLGATWLLVQPSPAPFRPGRAIRPFQTASKSWDDVPEDIKRTFDRLGIPEAERKFLADVGAQYDSEVVYHSLRQEWEKLGVIFLDMDSGLREHEDIVREYFATIIPAADNKFAALNSAVWSGGSFVYIPKGVHVDIPLQAYFRINYCRGSYVDRLGTTSTGHLAPRTT